MEDIVYQKRKTRSSTRTLVPYLSEEIIFIILSKLPFDLETINNCKLVTKLWYNLIYKIHPPKPTRLLIQKPSNVENSTRLVQLNEERDQAICLRNLNFNCAGAIKSTCNGLVLIQRYVNDNDGKSFLLFVLNPLTRQCIELRPCNFSQLPKWFMISFVPSSGEYKVVLAFDKVQNNFRYEILTLGSPESNWKTIRMTEIPRNSSYSAEQPVSINGILHFKIGSRNHLISVDVGDETVHKTKLPDGRILLKNLHLLEMKGSLGLIQNFYALMDIWVLEDFHKGEWTKLRRIDMLYPRPIRCLTVKLIPVACFRNGNVIILKVLYDDYKELHSLNIERLETKRIILEINDDSTCFPYTVAPYFLPGA